MNEDELFKDLVLEFVAKLQCHSLDKTKSISITFGDNNKEVVIWIREKSRVVKRREVK